VNLVNDEGIRDTLIDLHNYAAMALMLLDEWVERQWNASGTSVEREWNEWNANGMNGKELKYMDL
jgi:hypothetical protein